MEQNQIKRTEIGLNKGNVVILTIKKKRKKKHITVIIFFRQF